jgi:endoglucanase
MRHVRRAICVLSFALLAPVVGCAKGNDTAGTAGTSGTAGPGTAGASGGQTGMGGMGGSVGDDPFAGLPAAKALHVQGNLLKDMNGATVRLLGVNRAGSEYMCSPPTQGGTTFDGSTGPSSITALLTWNINAVRLPLNEHCWLGINNTLVSADEYQSAIIDYATRLHQKGLYVVLDLHWSAPGTTVITGGNGGNQLVTMAFADHAIAFWTSVANTFKNDPMVVFDLFNEPILDASDRIGNGPVSDPWGCWLNGCSTSKGPVAGMQQMLNAVRGTGATQVVVAGGIDWSHKLDGWLQHKPQDPAGNLMAAFHVYQPPLSNCSDTNCWNGVLKTVAQNVPVLTGEMGEQDCAHGFIDGYMSWADSQGGSVSYLGWAWNVQNCSSFPALITATDGTPTAFGQGLKDHLATMPALH